jgi:two-component system, OmpR family, response regulator CpxR
VAVITIDSGVFCHGREIAARVREQLGYAATDDEAIADVAAHRFGLARETLQRTLHGKGSLLGGITHEREKGTAYLRCAIAEVVLTDRLVCLGHTGHLLPPSLNHVLKVCLGGTHEYRLAEGARRGLSQREAEREIERDDQARAEWTRQLFDLGPWDKRLYDLFIAVQDGSVEGAATTICGCVGRPALQPNERTARALEDFRLAAEVGLALALRGHDVDVTCTDGAVTVLIRKHTLFLDRLRRELEEIAARVIGVRSATARPGPRYREPGIGFNIDLDVPSKVLLVDDEREFVHTLSERLEARSMAPVIAYDGEGALEAVESEQPEVMVLDLKMPGIDGLEVLRRVKRSHPDTEVIILTGHGSEAEERVAAELGAFAYLRKPVNIDLLTETMKAAYRKVSESRRRSDPDAG